MIRFIYNGEPKKLTKIMYEEYPQIGYSSLQKLFRKRDVKVNGKRVSEDCMIRSNDELTLYYSEKESDLDVVYEDEAIVVFYKPKKIRSQGKASFEEKVRERFPTYVLCHRLDTNTEGLLLFAKSEPIFDEIKKYFSEQKIKKYYLAWVYGDLQQAGTYKDYLRKDEGRKRVYLFDTPIAESKEAILHYTPMEHKDGCTLVDIELVTGRTHQIRAQFAYHGHPIIGDPKYGKEEYNRKFHVSTQKLVSYKIVFLTDSGVLKSLFGKEIVLHDIKL